MQLQSEGGFQLRSPPGFVPGASLVGPGYLSMWGNLKIAAVVAALVWLVKTGIRPGRNDPKAWYDRTIRIVGGIILLLVICFGFILNFTRR